MKKSRKVKRSKNSKAKKIALGVLVGYLAVVAVIYLGVSVYYMKHFYSGSKINGIDCSGKTVEDVEGIISDKIQEYTLSIREKDSQVENIVATQIDMKYVEDGKIKELKEKQNPFLWFTSIINHKDYNMSATTTYNKELLTAVIGNLGCFQEANVVAPQDAHIQEKDAGYEIIPEVVGNTLDKEKATKLITDAIDQGETEISFEDTECYIKPAIYSDDESLKSKLTQYNAYMGVSITYDFKDRQEVIDGTVIKTMMAEDDQGNVDLNRDKVLAYVKEIGRKTDTFGLSREFKTSLGSTISLKGGDYGWVIDKNKETDALIEQIKSGQSGTREPIYLYAGKERATNDIGGTYVEISIQDQRMWCYKDGSLIVDTPIVTGSVAKGYDTPAGGVWAVDAKKRDTFLTGQGYSSPVSYWMPFNGGVGIHDASWRSTFGGDIYKNGGSHGCVNTPFSDAEKIYNNIEIGSPIVVY